MVSSSGRGRPRPLLAGVYRKACDYCVKSKRGCNGGTPCEQCVRRSQQCTYSQRRKSGPRGRPARQAPGTDNSATPEGTLGTRNSTRKTKRSSFMSSCLPSSPMSTTSSPARTASISSSSSEYSPSEESSSDSEAEKSPVENCCEEVLIHVAKKGKISGCHPDEAQMLEDTQQVSPSSPRRDEKVPNVSNETRMEQPRGSLVARTASVVSQSKPPANAQPSEKESGLITSPSGRSAWMQPIPVEQSTNLHPQQHDNSSTNHGSETLSNGLRIHEISMQLGEISHAQGPRPVACGRTQPGGNSTETEGITYAANSTEASPSPQLSKSTDGLPGDVDVYNAVGTASVASAAADVNTHSPASSFGGSLLAQSEEELDGFDLDLEITKWEIPSLTREMSLARAVDALGGEQQTPGFDYDSSFVSGGWRFL